MGEAPVAGDLQATEDVQITPEIQALATRLGNNPVKIFQWVHDNIRYIPIYGMPLRNIMESHMLMLLR